jgi:hypothetical protein
MVRKIFAALLLILVVLPFTAPFPTCDASTLFGGSAPMSSHAPSIDRGQHALPTFSSAGRLRMRFLSQLSALDRVIDIEARSTRRMRPALSARRGDARAASLIALRI